MILEHIATDKDVRLGGQIKNPGGVAWRCMEARAKMNELCHPEVLVVEGVLNELCMELF